MSVDQASYTVDELLHTSLSELAARTGIARNTLYNRRVQAQRTRLESIVEGEELGPGALPYRYLHELVCIACGRYVASVPSDQPQPRQLLVPRGLRCSACGGAPIPSGDSERVLQPYDVSAEDDDKPRRGRPPKVTAP